ncbi:hypothetical protein BYT27DRAFT_7217800 [Phlegmacium glaucopus]|nr:hypothetical protein BYT27DRAFT_7217800 [Phlegmacium glaucopus]
MSTTYPRHIVPVPALVIAPKKVVAPASTARSAQRPSASVPVIQHSEANHEIHRPPPKDLPYTSAPKIRRKMKRSEGEEEGKSEEEHQYLNENTPRYQSTNESITTPRTIMRTNNGDGDMETALWSAF